MSVGGTTVYNGGIVTEQQAAEARAILQEYDTCRKSGCISESLGKKAIHAGLLLQAKIEQDTKAIDASKQRQVALKSQEQQSRSEAVALVAQGQQFKNTMQTQLQGLLNNITQKEAVKLQQFLNPQDPRRTIFLQQTQSLKAMVVDFMNRNQRGEKIDLKPIQNQYKVVFAQ